MKITITYSLKPIWGVLVLIFCLSLPVEVYAQLTDTTNTGQRGTPRIYKMSARTGALGDATVGDPTDISVININPAGLAFVGDLSSAEVNIAQNWNNNVVMENFTLPAIRYYAHTFAAQFSLQHDRGLNSFNLLGTNPMPQPKITMYQVDFVYAFTIEDVLSIGVLNNLSYAENSIAQFTTYYATLGMMYAPSQSISYGIALRGLGRSVVYDVVTRSQTILGSQDLRESLELGATLQFPVDTDETYLSLSMSNEKRFGEEGIWYKAGLEVRKIPFISLRAGILFQPETDVYAPRFGLGIISDWIDLDYTVSYSSELYERYHQLGITLHLNRL